MGFNYYDFLDGVNATTGAVGGIVKISPFSQLTTTFSDLFKNATGTLTSLGSSLSMPLMIVGGIVLLVMLKK